MYLWFQPLRHENMRIHVNNVIFFSLLQPYSLLVVEEDDLKKRQAQAYILLISLIHIIQKKKYCLFVCFFCSVLPFTLPFSLFLVHVVGIIKRYQFKNYHPKAKVLSSKSAKSYIETFWASQTFKI